MFIVFKYRIIISNYEIALYIYLTNSRDSRVQNIALGICVIIEFQFHNIFPYIVFIYAYSPLSRDLEKSCFFYQRLKVSRVYRKTCRLATPLQ